MGSQIKQKNTKSKVKRFQSINSLAFSLLAIFMLLTSCKSSKDLNTNRLSKNSALEIIELHNNAAINFKTYASKLRLDYDDGKKQVSPSATLRLEKDKQLWLSVKFLGFTVAKAYITPNEVQFYEKLGKRYYKGDFSAVSDFLGTTVTFKSLQDLLLGQSMLDLNKGKFEVAKNNKGNIDINPKKPSKKYSFTLSLDQLNYKVASYFIAQKEKNRRLDVVYEKYQTIDDQLFPSFMSIDAKAAKSYKKLNIEFKKVTLDNKLTFPFTIPSGYKSFRF